VTPVVAPLEIDEAEHVAQEAGLADIFVKMNLFRTSLRQPGVAQLWATVVNKLVVTGTLDARLRELVILRVAWVTNGSYEWSNHYPYAIGIGMNDKEILAVRHWQDEDPALTGDDRLVLQTVDSILAGRAPAAGKVEELKAIVRGDGPLMELLILPGIYHSLSMLTGTLGIALDEGRGAWLPDGVEPPVVQTHDRSSA